MGLKGMRQDGKGKEDMVITETNMKPTPEGYVSAL